MQISNGTPPINWRTVTDYRWNQFIENTVKKKEHWHWHENNEGGRDNKNTDFTGDDFMKCSQDLHKSIAELRGESNTPQKKYGGGRKKTKKKKRKSKKKKSKTRRRRR